MNQEPVNLCDIVKLNDISYDITTHTCSSSIHLYILLGFDIRGKDQESTLWICMGLPMDHHRNQGEKMVGCSCLTIIVMLLMARCVSLHKTSVIIASHVFWWL